MKPIKLILGLIVASSAQIAAAQRPGAIPNRTGQEMLIKTVLTAVSHGNLTGNFTVLRDLGSHRFRQANTATDLSRVFGELREKSIDLTPILVFESQLAQGPIVDETGRLRLTGFFPTRPSRVKFDLLFQNCGGGWLIDDVSVGIEARPHPTSRPPLQSQTVTATLPPTPPTPPYPTPKAGRRETAN